MAAFVNVEDLPRDVARGVHAGAFAASPTDTLRLALSNTAPGAESSDPTQQGNGVVANVTQIAYTNVSGGQPTLAGVSSSVNATTGVLTLDADDEVILAAGGAIPTFRYVYLFNDTATGDPIMGHWDLGQTYDLADGEQLTLQLSASGLLTVSLS